VMFYGFGDDPATEAAAFAAGADDYVARTGTVNTITARINAILRRASHLSPGCAHQLEETIRVGEIHLQHQGYAATVAGRVIPLTVSEFRILWKLARSRGAALQASELAPLGGNLDRGTPERSVRSHICALRRKLGPSAGSQIQTVRNAGYRLSEG
jgi:DNA-binding response OmpR family regulator